MNQDQLDAYHGHLEFARLKVTKSRFVQPWERGFLKRTAIFPACPPAITDGGVGSASELSVKRVEQQFDQKEFEKVQSYFKKFRSKFARTSRQTWMEKLDYDRRAAFVKWQKILITSLLDFQVGAQFRQMRLANRSPNFSQYFSDVFALKSTLTLHTRANPILRYLTWAKGRGYQGIPFRESEVYEFLSDIAQPFAPTFPKSFVGSVAFMHYILDCRSAKPCIDSRRITVCASRQYLLKRKLKQKKPLSVKQVIGLEKICIGDVEASIEERVASGFFLYMIYARARHSDAQSSGLIQLEVDDGDDGMEGFVEASVTRSKTSYSLERKTRYLPMSAPIRGLIQTDSWAVKWFENMRIANLPRGYGLPLLPSPDRSGGWNTLPLSAEASTAWLRHLLLKCGTERGALMSYGTHSLKATVLSWLAKRGIPRDVRAALGYHAKAVDGTEVVYGRDNMAAPLRTMIGVICEVSEGSFKPDATKSGMLITRLKPTVEISTGDVLADAGLKKAGEQLGPLGERLVDVNLAEDGEAAVDDIVSTSEESEDESEPEHDATESAIDSVIGRWNPVVGLDSQTAVVFVRHSISRMLHVAADEYAEKFMCGRELNPVYFKLSEKPKVFHPMCAQCLKTLQKHAKTAKQTSKRRGKSQGCCT